MIPTRMRRGRHRCRARPRSERGRIPDGRSVAIAAGDPSPALTGARGLSRKADSDGSPGSDGPSSWAYDYTAPLHNDASGGDSVGARAYPSRLSRTSVLSSRPRPANRRPPMPSAIPAAAAARLPPARMIDPRGHRFGAGVSAILLSSRPFTGTPWLVALVLLSIGVERRVRPPVLDLRRDLAPDRRGRPASARSSPSTSTRRASPRCSAASR